jgi:heme/copper-type cytochrome/quinol oxidase subunit 2
MFVKTMLTQSMNVKSAPRRTTERVFVRGIRAAAWAAMWVAVATALKASSQPHVVQVLADKSSHFRVPGRGKPEIVLKAGEPVLLRIEAQKSRTWNRDGVVHGFTVLRMKDHSKIPDWDLELRPGTQEFTLTAPRETGEYEVLCTVICSGDHEGMRMKLIVVP